MSSSAHTHLFIYFCFVIYEAFNATDVATTPVAFSKTKFKDFDFDQPFNFFVY